MEIILGLLSAGSVELIKLLSSKFGNELSRNIVHGLVFAIVLGFTTAITSGFLTWETINYYIQIFVTSYATYNLIIKPAKNKIIK